MVELTEDEVRAQNGGWLGANPYYLMITLNPTIDGKVTQTVAEIDLDQKGWMAWYSSYLRNPGQWYLVRKEDRIVVLTMLVNEGEQPYYVGQHAGFTSVNSGGPHGETIVHGIGKKRLDGHVDRLWVLANGTATVGDDARDIAVDMLKAGML